MAESGFTYDQILTHYYSGASIQQGSLPPSIKVGILTNQSELLFTSEAGLYIDMGAERLLTTGPNELWRVRLSGIQYQLVSPDGQIFGSYVYPIRFSPVQGVVSLPQKTSYSRYRGSMIAQITANGLTAVNELPFDQYLYGTVPSEMPFGWPAEALKAQACAARNYAVKNMGKHGSYDLCNTVHCQVYLGLDHEKPQTTAAVDSTSGKLIYADGQLIIAYYHSTCGGSTENSENVWTNPLSYLKAAPCPYCASSPHRDWSASFTVSELEAKLNADLKTAVSGALTGIGISSLRGERRVGMIKLIATAGEKEVSAGKLRGVLGTSTLKSTWFTIDGANQAGQSVATMVIGEAGYKLNDVFTKTDAAPYIKGGRTYVPIRYLANAIGIGDGGIIWNGSTRTASLTKGTDTVNLMVGSKSLFKNTIVTSMDVAPEITTYGRTMLPARFVAEAFGASVFWNASLKTVTVTY